MSTELQVYAPEGRQVATRKMYVLLAAAGGEDELSVGLARFGFSRIAGSNIWERGIHRAMVLGVPPGAQVPGPEMLPGHAGVWGRYEVVLIKINMPKVPTRSARPTVDTAGLGRVSLWLQGETLHARVRIRSPLPGRALTNALQYTGVDARTFGHAHIHPVWLKAWVRDELPGCEEKALRAIESSQPAQFSTFTGASTPPRFYSTFGLAAYTMASRNTLPDMSRRNYLVALMYPELAPRQSGSSGVATQAEQADGKHEETSGTAASVKMEGRGYDVWYDSDGEEIPELIDPSDSSDDGEQ